MVRRELVGRGHEPDAQRFAYESGTYWRPGAGFTVQPVWLAPSRREIQGSVNLREDFSVPRERE